MKPKIKALTCEKVRLFWSKNGWDHNAVGVIGKLYESEFDFTINGNMVIKIKYERVKDVEAVKDKKLSDLQKLQIAIEALEYYKKMSKDSRNFGMISTKIDQALKEIK